MSIVEIIERARRAQELYERRINVQLSLLTQKEICDTLDESDGRESQPPGNGIVAREADSEGDATALPSDNRIP